MDYKTRFDGTNFILEDNTVITPETMCEWYDNLRKYLDDLMEKTHDCKDSR